MGLRLERIRAACGWVLAKLWDWPVVAGGALLIYGVGAGALYGDDYFIASVLFFIAIVWITARALAWEETKHHENRRTISTVLVFIGVVVFAFSFWWVRYRAGQKIHTPTAEENAAATVAALKQQDDSRTAVELECEWDHLPIQIPANEFALVLLLNKKMRKSGMGFYDLPGGYSKNYSWPTKNQLNLPHPKKALGNMGETIYRCKVSNQGNTKLFDVALTFRLQYMVPTPSSPANPGNQHGDNQEYPYEIVANPLPPGIPFTFYVVNECPANVIVFQPSQYTTLILGESQRRQFPLLIPHRNPLEFFMMLFGSSVDWTGEPCD